MSEDSASQNPKQTYGEFLLSNLRLGFGSFGSKDNPLPLPPPPPPPCVEVLLSEDESLAESNAELFVISGVITLLKGRKSAYDVFGVANSDLVPGKYEGGLKLWEGSIDLVRTLNLEIMDGRLALEGKRVLELGCGHGLPGIFAGLKGAAAVHFQDFNAEVLQSLTIPNVNANLKKEVLEGQHLLTNKSEMNMISGVRFFAGDWSEIHQLLFSDCNNENWNLTDPKKEGCNGYDVILMAETVYSLSALPNLYALIKKCLHPSGVVYMAGKKHYFGVGGGTRQFLHLVEKDGIMAACVLAEVADGSCNLREVWKLSFK